MEHGDLFLNDIWNSTLNSFLEKEPLDDNVFSYLSDSKLQSLETNKAIVVTPAFINFTIMSQYQSLLEKCLQGVTGNPATLEIVMKKDLPEVINTVTPVNNQFLSNKIDTNCTFDNFVVGRSNAQAHMAASTCASNPGYFYNPLFIYGESGIGKTHLLNAIGNHIKKDFPNMKVGYIAGADFVDDVYLASKTKQYDELKQAFKELDLLLVDDIQFIADKPKTHEIFFTIFNHLVNNKKQICVTSDKSPEEIKGLETRLITRFNQGLTVSISSPEYETAVNILKMKIINRSVSQQINDDVISFIATNFSQNVRELEGALNRLLFYSINWSEDKDSISLALATEAFKDQIQSNKDILSFLKIEKAVCNYYNLSKEQLTSKNRTKNIMNARHIAIYLCRKLLDEPYETIGNEFGKRDHSTIMNSCERVEELIKSDPIYQKVVSEIESKLKK